MTILSKIEHTRKRSVAAKKNGCSEMQLYFFDYPCYNLPDWKKSKRGRSEHLLFSGQAAKNQRF